MTLRYRSSTDVHERENYASKNLSEAIRQRVAMMQGRAGICHNEGVESCNNVVNAGLTRYNRRTVTLARVSDMHITFNACAKGDVGEQE